MKINDFLHFGTSNDFPEPFKGRPLVAKHSSRYSTSSVGAAAGGRVVSTRTSHTAVKAIVAAYYGDNNKENMSFGFTANSSICERKTVDTNGKQTTEVAVYYDSGVLDWFSVDSDTNALSYNVSSLTLLMSLWEVISQDDEFYEYYTLFQSAMDNKDLDKAWDAIEVLSDNIYRRLKDGLIQIQDTKKSIMEINRNISNGVYVPTSISFGKFEFLGARRENVETSIPLDDFIGKYQIDTSRQFTAEEKANMEANKLEDYYIVMPDDVEICNDIINTSKLNKPFRTFTLVGPPGTGKSKKAQAISNALVLPHVIFTCNPSTEIFDLIGQMMPPSMDDMERDAWDLAARLNELGGINFENVAKVYELPTVEDIMMCPNDVYEEITGNSKTLFGEVPTVNDAVKVWTEHIADKFNDVIRKMTVAMKTGSGFRYTETDFIKAVENGWSVEIQEPNVILNEGVMVGLNSILNEGIITLQNGKVIRRHKDNVIFFTTNHNLNGLRDMNQSFIDRSDEIFYIERPSVPVVADRVMSISGNSDRKMVIEMAKLGETIQKAMDKEGIDDGICGMRSLIAWATKATYTNPYDAAIKTIINKTSMDPTNRNRLLKKLDESWFYQFKK